MRKSFRFAAFAALVAFVSTFAAAPAQAQVVIEEECELVHVPSMGVVLLHCEEEVVGYQTVPRQRTWAPGYYYYYSGEPGRTARDGLRRAEDLHGFVGGTTALRGYYRHNPPPVRVAPQMHVRPPQMRMIPQTRVGPRPEHLRPYR